MSKITKVTAGAKKSKNFQTYEVTLESEGPFTEEQAEVEIKKLQTYARKLAMEQIALDNLK